MPKNLAVLLYVVFVALALVSRVGGGIDQIAYAQLWHFSPPIDDQNQNANNLPFNKNSIQPSSTPATSPQFNKSPIQPSNDKPNMSSNCMATSSGAGKDIMLSSSSSSSSSQSNTLNTSPSTTSITSLNCDKQYQFDPCPHLKVTDDVGFIIPRAEVLQYGNVIKAVSTPPIVIGAASVNNTKGNTVFATDPADETKLPFVLSPTLIPSQVQEICGTNHDDYIIGSEGDDIIFGLLGNDVISALGGDDQVFGGAGDDTVYGGDGNNQLFGDDGNDNLVGGIADDVLVGGHGNDRLYGNTGDDILQGGSGADYFDCGDGVDSVIDYNPSQGDVVSTNCENVNTIH